MTNIGGNLYLSKLQNVFVQIDKYICCTTNHIPSPPSWSRWPALVVMINSMFVVEVVSSICTSGRSPLEVICICLNCKMHLIKLTNIFVLPLVSSIFTSGRSPLEGTAPICYQINKHFAHPSPPLLCTTCCMHNHWCARIQIHTFTVDIFNKHYLAWLYLAMSDIKTLLLYFPLQSGNNSYYMQSDTWYFFIDFVPPKNISIVCTFLYLRKTFHQEYTPDL